MPFIITTATKRVANLTKRIRCVQGGTSASKTISILLYLIHRALDDDTPKITSIVAESLPHLKRGAMRDFLNIIQEHKYFKEKNWNKTDFIYTFENGSKIEFFGVEQVDKVRGPRRDRLFINEANNVGWNIFEQLEVRTNDFIFLDWNPVNSFWVYENVIGARNDVEHIVLTYLHNEALSESIRASIEQRKSRPGWWKVYGLGQLGEVEGKIYNGWEIIDEIPKEARLERHWVDFGYANHPSAIGNLYYYNGGYILEEVAYQHGMNNKDIADVLMNLRRVLTVADSAEPKSIAEIRSFGVNIMPAAKGKGSVVQGIQLVQSQSMSVTRTSPNILKEYRNYLWKVDKDGNVLNEPEDEFNHHMDGIRYAMNSLVPIIRRREWAGEESSKERKVKINPAR